MERNLSLLRQIKYMYMTHNAIPVYIFQRSSQMVVCNDRYKYIHYSIIYDEEELEETWVVYGGERKRLNVVEVTPYNILWQVDTLD